MKSQITDKNITIFPILQMGNLISGKTCNNVQAACPLTQLHETYKPLFLTCIIYTHVLKSK